MTRSAITTLLYSFWNLILIKQFCKMETVLCLRKTPPDIPLKCRSVATSEQVELSLKKSWNVLLKKWRHSWIPWRLKYSQCKFKHSTIGFISNLIGFWYGFVHSNINKLYDVRITLFSCFAYRFIKLPFVGIFAMFHKDFVPNMSIIICELFNSLSYTVLCLVFICEKLAKMAILWFVYLAQFARSHFS
jgi:hypothetical protein